MLNVHLFRKIMGADFGPSEIDAKNISRGKIAECRLGILKSSYKQRRRI